ncbi:MAG: hypothetical protein H6975_03680 [Gammaproteobacteria bacterium]|nr:hypothetical protein [Gammaproteobacteria bacterium]
MNLLKTLQPITFHRVFVDITGSINAALMLSNALYWTHHLKPDRDGWFYKTREEWQAETGLTRKEQDNARQRLTRLGILETRRAKVFPDDCITAIWWKIDLNRLQGFLDSIDQLSKTDNCQLPLRDDQLPERDNPTPYNPSTTNNTTTTARDFANADTATGKPLPSATASARAANAETGFPQSIPTDWQPQPETVNQLVREGMTLDFIASVREEFLLFWLITGHAKRCWDSAFLRQARCEHAYHQTQETRRHERSAIRQSVARQPTHPARGPRKESLHERNERYQRFIDDKHDREDAYDAISGDFIRH